MSAANFWTMRNFPLFAKDYYEETKRCPECGTILDADAEVCESCGCEDLEDYAYCDEIAADEEWAEITGLMDELNRDLLFHKVEMRSGYYSGVQFYVEVEHDLGEDKDYTNDDCHYYFDCCRSVAYRKYAAEVRKIVRKLTEFAERYGFQEYVCTARFSNGEAWFELASNPRACLRAAAV